MELLGRELWLVLGGFRQCGGTAGPVHRRSAFPRAYGTFPANARIRLGQDEHRLARALAGKSEDLGSHHPDLAPTVLDRLGPRADLFLLWISASPASSPRRSARGLGRNH